MKAVDALTVVPCFVKQKKGYHYVCHCSGNCVLLLEGHSLDYLNKSIQYILYLIIYKNRINRYKLKK